MALRGSALALGAAFALLPAARAGADLLTLVADGRYVLVDHCPAFDPCQSETARPPAPFAPFDDAVEIVGMSASQDSRVDAADDPSSMSGSLASESPSEPPFGNTLGDAVFDVTFEPTAAASYAWSGAGAISGGGYGGALLYDLTSDRVLFETSLPASFQHSGDLEAGHRYRLLHHATTLGQGSASWDFDLSVVPEPDGALARTGGLGLVAMLARRRSRKRTRARPPVRDALCARCTSADPGSRTKRTTY